MIGTPQRSLGNIIFDATFEESHQHDLQVTDNPVESGVVISDHAFMLPLKLTIYAGVSDSPIDEQPGQFSDNRRSVQAFETMSNLQRSAEPFDVQTGLRLYKNMVCVSIRTAQDVATSMAFIFTAELRQVIIVKTETVKYKSRKIKSDQGNTSSDKQATPKDGSTARQANPTNERGKVAGNEVKSKAKQSSIAKKLKDALGINL
jgi:hypothetical protein